MIQEVLKKLVNDALEKLSLENATIIFDHPADLEHGDYTTSIALQIGKQQGLPAQAGKNPRELAEQIANEIRSVGNEYIEKVESAGQGFINFYLSQKFFREQLMVILQRGGSYGRLTLNKGRKMMVEYTDPNPFKEFHIGHLMSNSIGESLARLFEASGAEVKRAIYQGDVGMHVAKTVWGMMKSKDVMPSNTVSYTEKLAYLGKSYAIGATAYENDETAKKDIGEINKKIFDKSDTEINKLYDTGKKWSLDAFEEIYKRLGTKFDFYFLESEAALLGGKIVEEFLGKGVFEKSDGAIVWKGESEGLHTRVFINSQGLPTYEAKELGLSKKKFDTYSFDRSVVVTANEQNDYFKVVLRVLEKIYPDIAKRTLHLGHGMLRLPTGKMSSRTGDIITAESLIEDAKKIILEKMSGEKTVEFSDAEKQVVAEAVAIGAIKYSILRQAIGKDIIFDFDQSLSFEGNSGPYLQYTYARAKSVIRKASGVHIEPSIERGKEPITAPERLLYRFGEVVERAGREYAPHYVATYLYELASSFNAYYHDYIVVDKEHADTSAFRVAITSAVATVLKNGLVVLGIQAPERM